MCDVVNYLIQVKLKLRGENPPGARAPDGPLVAPPVVLSTPLGPIYAGLRRGFN